MNFRLLLAPSTCLAAALLLSACGSSPKPSAQALGDVKIEQALVPAWSVKLAGDTALNQSLPMQDGQLAMVSKNGHVGINLSRSNVNDPQTPQTFVCRRRGLINPSRRVS